MYTVYLPIMLYFINNINILNYSPQSSALIILWIMKTCVCLKFILKSITFDFCKAFNVNKYIFNKKKGFRIGINKNVKKSITIREKNLI